MADTNVIIAKLMLKAGATAHRSGDFWRIGTKRLHDSTVRRLIDDGIAVRDGDCVRAKEPA